MHSTRSAGRIGKSVTFTRTRARRGLTVLGAAATLVSAMAAPASAFAPEGGEARGFGSTGLDDAAGKGVTTCQNVFSGEVTDNSGSGQGGEISIDDISFSPCDPRAGISVRANNLPWTLKLDSRRQLTVEGVDLNIVTRAGTSRYTGALGGAESFDGVYTISGALTRRSAGGGGPTRLGISVLAESITVDGAELKP